MAGGRGITLPIPDARAPTIASGAGELTIGGRSVAVDLYEQKRSTCPGVTSIRYAVDRLSGIVLESQSTFERRWDDYDVPQANTVTRTVARRPSEGLGDRVQVYVQETVTGKRGKRFMREVSTDVPGLLVASSVWNQSAAHGSKPNYAESVVDWGTDANLLSAYRRENPTTAERRENAAVERKQGVRDLYAQTIADLSHADEERRRSAASLLGRWPGPAEAETRKKVVAALKHSLEDPFRCQIWDAAERLRRRLRSLASLPSGQRDVEFVKNSSRADFSP